MNTITTLPDVSTRRIMEAPKGYRLPGRRHGSTNYPAPCAGRRWSGDEDLYLMRMSKLNASTTFMAQQLGRSYVATAHRRFLLGCGPQQRKAAA